MPCLYLPVSHLTYASPCLPDSLCPFISLSFLSLPSVSLIYLFLVALSQSPCLPSCLCPIPASLLTCVLSLPLPTCLCPLLASQPDASFYSCLSNAPTTFNVRWVLLVPRRATVTTPRLRVSHYPPVDFPPLAHVNTKRRSSAHMKLPPSLPTLLPVSVLSSPPSLLSLLFLPPHCSSFLVSLLR